MFHFRDRRQIQNQMLHIDTVNQTLDGVTTVRPIGTLHIVPDREELVNQVRIISPTGVITQANNQNSINDYGTNLFEFNSLAEEPYNTTLATNLLNQFSKPRESVSQVTLDPYFAGEQITRLVYRLKVGDVVRLTYLAPRNPRSSVGAATSPQSSVEVVPRRQPGQTYPVR